MPDEPPTAQAAPNRQPPKPLAKLPLPPWVVALAAVTALAFVFALGRLPGSISLAVDAERAHRLVENGEGEEAVRLLEPIVRAYPRAIDARVDLADAYELAKRPGDAGKVLDSFSDVGVNPEQGARLDEVEQRVNADIGAKQAPGGKEDRP